MTSKQPEHIDMLAMRLHEEIKEFKRALAKNKKNLTKNDLCNLLVGFVSYPVEEHEGRDDALSKSLLKMGTDSKMTATHLAIEQLAIESKENKYGL